MIEQGTAAFWKTTLMIFVAGFTTFSILYGVQPLLPMFSATFNISPAKAGLSMSATTISMAVGMLVISVISDLWNRKLMMIVSLLFSSVISLLLTLSPTFSVILLLRMLQGFSLAALPAIAMTYLSEEIGPRSLSVAMGIYISGNSLGGMIGRIVSGVITDWYGWHIAMLFLGLLGIISGLLFSFFLPPSRHYKKQSPQWNILFLSVGKVFRHSGLVWLFSIGFVLMGCFVCLFNYIGYHLSEPPYLLSQSLIGWIFVVYVAGTFSSTWMGKLAGEHNIGYVMLSGVLLMIFGVLLTLHASLWVKVIGLALFSFGFFGSHSVASSWVGGMSGTLKSQAAPLYLFFYYVGSSVIGMTGGVFWSEYKWKGVVFLIVMMLFSLLLVSLRMVYVLQQGENGAYKYSN